MSSIEQRIKEGEAAKRLLNDRMVQQAFDRAEERIVAEWKNAATAEEREMLWARMRGLADIQTELRRTVADGEHVKKAKGA